MNSKMEKALKTKFEESQKTTNQLLTEHQSSTQIEMTVYYRLITSELTDGEIAQQAMDAVNQANLAKSKNYGKTEQQEKNALESKEVDDTSSQQDSVG